MHMNARPPIFVPHAHRAEIEKMSKAALMDLAWDMATQLTPPDDDGGPPTDDEIAGTLRGIADIILTHRKA